MIGKLTQPALDAVTSAPDASSFIYIPSLLLAYLLTWHTGPVKYEHVNAQSVLSAQTTHHQFSLVTIFNVHQSLLIYADWLDRL